MNWRASIANSLWLGSCLPAAQRFRRAIDRPAEFQQKILLRQIARNTGCAYGKAHRFGSITSYEEFARRVPLVTYEDIEPWIDRIQQGEEGVLTSERVTHLIPTSGSTGGRKLIPFTAGLQREFDRTIGPWMADLAGQRPGILWGPAYWSITPPVPGTETGSSKVPIGFADDASYLGGFKQWLVRSATAGPGNFRPGTGLDEFRFETLLCLLGERELRLISIWHPSFLTLLLDALPDYWRDLLARLRRKNFQRARELERCDPRRPESFWPYLQVISCWGDASAAMALADLSRRFPNIFIQPKGLLATEAFVTFPLGGFHPLAINSHFFEFIDEAGNIRRAHELKEQGIYEVVVTMAGGLWRYRLSDQVQVSGFLGRTPSLRFLGRMGKVVDKFGEKLSEQFVVEVIRRWMGEAGVRAPFALLAPENGPEGWHYTLYFEGEFQANPERRLDEMLRENPHYALCRDLGQLHPARIIQIGAHSFEKYIFYMSQNGFRIGEIKPSTLVQSSGWSEVFTLITPADLQGGQNLGKGLSVGKSGAHSRT